MACHLKPSQTFTDAQLRASCQAVSMPGMATAPPSTAGLSRGKWGLPNATLGGRLPALQDTYSTHCHRKAKKIIKDNNHPIHCLFTPLSSRRRGQYRCIKAGIERLKNSFYQGHRNVKQPSLAQRPLHYIHTLEITYQFNNGTLVTLIMFTHFALFISYVYTVFCPILLYISLCRSDIAHSNIYIFLIPFLYFRLCALLDITC